MSGKITHHFRGLYGLYIPQINKENPQGHATWNQFEVETLGFWPIRATSQTSQEP
jgi:hypothetical protein